MTLMTAAPLLRCAQCSAYYHDEPDGRRAHVLVFGHQAAVGAEVDA